MKLLTWINRVIKINLRDSDLRQNLKWLDDIDIMISFERNKWNQDREVEVLLMFEFFECYW